MELKQVLHFYLGCEVQIHPHDEDKRRAMFIGFSDEHKLSARVKFRAGPEGRINLLFIKPILRPLSSMTEEEDQRADDIYYSIADTDSQDFEKVTKADAAKTIFLLSKGFDLFNLIPEGKAIDATSLTNQSLK